LTAKTFILCIGAPKAGTTWLYHYLKSFRQVNLGFKKEYHVFDVVNIDSCRFYAESGKANAKSVSTAFHRKSAKNIQMLSGFRENHELYFDYFESLYSDSIFLSADITPTYLKLPKSVFRQIKNGFESRNIRLKVVLLLRDPVDRLVSSARMAKRFGGVAGVKVDKTSNMNEILRILYKTPHIVSNGDYISALESVRSCYTDDDLHIGLYENMFEDNEILRLSNFLNLEPNYDLAKRKFNVSSHKDDMAIDPELLARIRKTYDKQYEFFKLEFQGEYSGGLWRYY
jgi:hypothetical protein